MSSLIHVVEAERQNWASLWYVHTNREDDFRKTSLLTKEECDKSFLKGHDIWCWLQDVVGYQLSLLKTAQETE